MQSFRVLGFLPQNLNRNDLPQPNEKKSSVLLYHTAHQNLPRNSSGLRQTNSIGFFFCRFALQFFRLELRQETNRHNFTRKFTRFFVGLKSIKTKAPKIKPFFFALNKSAILKPLYLHLCQKHTKARKSPFIFLCRGFSLSCCIFIRYEIKKLLKRLKLSQIKSVILCPLKYPIFAPYKSRNKTF